MRYYGVSEIYSSGLGIIFQVLRYEGPANQFIYSLPMAQSNSTFRTRADIMYLCNDSGSVTVTECATNTDLVGVTLQPGSAYVPESVFGNNIVKLESGNTIPILTMVIASHVNNKFVTNVNTISVSNSFSIPVNNYAIVVEGTLTISNTSLDSNNDLHIINSSDETREVTGEGKLVIFEMVDG